MRALVFAALKRPAFWGGQSLAIGAVLAATMLRQLMSPLVQDEMPHIPYLAAVLVVAWRSGMAAGITTTVLSAFAANWIFVGDIGRFAIEDDDFWATAFFILFGIAMAWLPARLAAAIRREAELAGRLALVNGELQHRIRNIVTVIQSIVSQSARTATSTADLKAKVDNRLQAMSHALKLLNMADETVPLRAVAAAVLEPFRMEGTLNVSGPEVSIPGEVALQLALLLHELATNAVKYGALSAPTGVVHLTWESLGVVTELSWREEGGPPVRTPTRSGFGSRLVRAALPNGEVRMEYPPSGVVCSVLLRSHAHPA